MTRRAKLIYRSTCTLFVAGVVVAATLFGPSAGGHESDEFRADRRRPYRGSGFKNALGGTPALGFPASGVHLLAWIPLSELDPTASSGDDCWGYVSPSGRQYALIGISTGTGIVEVTDPGDPNILGVIPGPTSSWRDIKVYQQYAYAVSEGGDGIQVLDLTQVDAGIVLLVNTVTAAGTLTTSSTHNVVINEESGMLYRLGGGSGTIGMRAYDLTDPVNPTYVGEWHTRYIHDAQVVTWTDPPYAGQEIAFCFCDDTSGGGNPGMSILNVTDPANITQIGATAYGSSAFSHQGWLSTDRQYVYLNDELDEQNFGSPTTTRIMDVSDLTSPVAAGTFTNGNSAIDHNLYTKGNLIFEANYRSGLRVYDASNPTAPVETAFFDTWPEDDNPSFNGLWNVYPYLPNQAILGSDIEKGLFVWWLGDPQLTFAYPNGLPNLLSPQGATVTVQISEQSGGSLVGGTAKLHFDDGGGFNEVVLNPLGGDQYEAVFPTLPCGADVKYFFSGETANGISWRDPVGAPTSVHSAVAASSLLVTLTENFEDPGWTGLNLGAVSGDWQRGVPVDDGAWDYDPATDSDGSGQCWLTENAGGNTDVDDGAVELTSNLYDLSSGNVLIGYDYFLRLTAANGSDAIVVEISSNDTAGPWIEVARHDTDGGLSWRSHQIDQPTLDAAGVTMTANMRLRFTVNDGSPQSIVEAGLDAFDVTEVVCGILGDTNADSVVDVADLLAILGQWGACIGCPEDVNGDDVVNVSDLLLVLANWT